MREKKLPEGSEVRRRLDELDFIDFLKYLIGQMKWIAAFVAVVVALTAGYVFLIAKPEYETEVQVYVSSGEDSSGYFANMQVGSYLVADYEYVFQAWQVHQQVIENLNLPYTMDEFGKMVEVKRPSGTRLLIIKVCAEDPVEAAQIADEYAAVAGKYIAEAMSADEPVIVSRARVPDKPVKPKKMTTLAVAAVIGGFAAVCLLMIAFLADDRIREPEDLWRFLRKRPAVVFPSSEEESGCQKASNLLGLQLTARSTAKRIELVSYRDGEGKRFVAEGLARSLSEIGKKIAIVDASFSEPDGFPGLAECLEHRCELTEALHPMGSNGVFRLSCGAMGEKTSELMASVRLQELLAELEGQFDVVLIDAPSMEESVDSLRIAAGCDAVLLVVRCCMSRANEISEAIRQLEGATRCSVEIVLNGAADQKRTKGKRGKQ